jgi:hypothetical protein
MIKGSRGVNNGDQCVRRARIYRRRFPSFPAHSLASISISTQLAVSYQARHVRKHFLLGVSCLRFIEPILAVTQTHGFVTSPVIKGEGCVIYFPDCYLTFFSSLVDKKELNGNWLICEKSFHLS